MGGITLEKLKVIIEAYTKPYTDEMNRVKEETKKATESVERHNGRIRNSFKKTAAVIGSVLSIAAVIAFGKSCVQLGSDLSEVQNVVDVTFTSMSQSVDAFAKGAITQYGLSELAAKRYMGTYGAMAKAFNFTESQAYQMSTAITGLTGDVASFYNLSTDQAYTKLKSIFTGETESLKDLGVVMTQTALDQYALNNGFGKTTAKMTEQEKVMLRYQFVMDQLSDASGDFIRTSDSWANQTRILSLRFEQLKATIGQGLINALTPVIQVINSILARLQVLAEYFRAFTGIVFGDAGPAGGLEDSVGGAADAAGNLENSMGAAAKAAKSIRNTLGIDELNIVSDDSGSGAGGGASAGGDFDFGKIEEGSSVVDVMDQKFSAMFEKILGYAQPTIDAFKRLWNEGLSLLSNFSWTSLKDFWDYFLVPLGLWTMGTGFPMFLDSVNNFLIKINWDSINEALKNFWTALEPFAEKVGEGLLDFFDDMLSFGADFINLVVPGGLNGIADALNKIDPQTAKDVGYALGAIAAGVIAFKGLEKPMTIIAEIGKALASLEGLKPINLAGLFNVDLSSPAFFTLGNLIVDGIDWALSQIMPERGIEFLGTIMAGMCTGGALGSFIPGAGTVAGMIIGGIVGALAFVDWSSVWSQLTSRLFSYDWMRALYDEACGFFAKAFSADNFIEFGLNIVAGLAAGLSSGVAFFLEPIGNLFDWIVGGICDIFGIHSPADSMYPIGENIILGIVEGFVNSFFYFTDSVYLWWEESVSPWFTLEKWQQLFASIPSSLKSEVANMTKGWKTDISTWWTKSVTPWFTIEKWQDLLSKIPEAFKTSFKNAANGAIGIFNRLIEWINSKMHFSWESFEIAGHEIVPAGSVQLFTIPKIPMFRTGGFPEDGLFMANSSELVGRFSNGRTAVANNDQIISGISSGVREANSEQNGLLERMIYLLELLLDKDTDIALDGKSVKKGTEESSRRSGFQFKPA